MLIENVKIYTMDNPGIIENGYALCEEGVFLEVGLGEPHEGYYNGEVVDGNGCFMLPGFIDAHTHLGIIEDSLSFEGDDVNETGDPITPQLRAIDAVNPFDRAFSDALAAGITTVAISPGSANPIGGQICVLKTAGEVVDDMAVRAPAAIKLALGENPKSLYHGKNLAPETRMAIAALIREALFKAERYKNDRRAAEDDEELDPPEFDFKSEALADAFDLNLPFHIHAHRADDIFTGIRIAEEFGIKYSIIHCTDGAKVAKRLGDLHINAIVGPYLTDRSKPELSSQSAATPGILAAAGVCVAITTDHPETPLKYLPLCASIAVKEGMDELSALAAITINPAKILEIEGRVGSITRGKDADFALWSGHPFELTSKPLSVYIKGKRVFNA